MWSTWRGFCFFYSFPEPTWGREPKRIKYYSARLSLCSKYSARREIGSLRVNPKLITLINRIIKLTECAFFRKTIKNNGKYQIYIFAKSKHLYTIMKCQHIFFHFLKHSLKFLELKRFVRQQDQALKDTFFHIHLAVQSK